MSLVSPQHWEFWMGRMPMPDGCEFETMFAMYDAVKKIDDQDYAAKQLNWYESLWRKYKPKYDLASELDDESKLINMHHCLNLIREGIVFYRKELTG